MNADARHAPRRDLRATRRASSRSRSTRTRSATSSDRAARRSARSSSAPAARSRSTTTVASTSRSSDEIAAQKAVGDHQELTAEAELGKTYLGKVVRVVNFGAFVEVLPGVEGLLHISEIDEQRINEVRDVLDEGHEVLGQGHRHRRPGSRAAVAKGHPARAARRGS